MKNNTWSDMKSCIQTLIASVYNFSQENSNYLVNIVKKKMFSDAACAILNSYFNEY